MTGTRLLSSPLQSYSNNFIHGLQELFAKTHKLFWIPPTRRAWISVLAVAGLSFFLLVLAYQTTLDPADANIENLADMVYVRSPSFNCSYIGVNPRAVVEEQQYHTFPSNSNIANSCQSKYQQHCFRKNSTPKFFPPSKFLSVLRDYESYHERCTLGYNLTDLALGGKAPENCKYLVWKSMDGMGNQLVSLVSSFVYSLLTKRAMLIATDSKIQTHLCNPFPSSSWVLPEGFREPDLRTKAKRLFVYLDEVFQKKKGKCTTAEDDLGQLIAEAPSRLQVYIMCCDAGRDHQFFCPTAQRLLTGVSWMFFHSHEYTLSALYFVPEFRKTLNDWFPEKDVYMHASRYLLNPENGLWARIIQFHKSNLVGADKRIGIQARSWSGNYNPSVSKQILRCGIEQGLLPPPPDHVDPSKHPQIDHPEKISVMVASLRAEYYQNLADKYSNSNDSFVTVVTASHEGLQRTGDLEHDRKAIVDIWLLSFMDDMVITPFSTFGSSASGLAGIIPILFNNYEQDKVSEPACKRSNLAGPCFIKYPRNQPCDLDPARSSIFDPGFMLPEVKYCDLNPGLGVYAGR